MRLVRIKTPEGGGEEVAQVAFAAGIAQVTAHRQEVRRANGERETKDVIDVETATPKAKAFLDALMASPFFDSEEYSIAVRQPRSIVGREKPPETTRCSACAVRLYKVLRSARRKIDSLMRPLCPFVSSCLGGESS